ncbi:dephospho-CoA kinase [Stappia sp. ES.058]|uniref:dephospho-CoA kinase n=1 Tax=Stappia sp. ES.058 TaxID=1881061 RepID=UPI0008793604|nr:dephospho-CoA kinase [Stappia sp. ES.058]SDU41956.1 dephospho-CoA kinase [Stappia sp. ES.058]
MIVVGLTGSIGMGKSTTAAMFAAAGAAVYDADAAVHDLYRSEAAPAIDAAFPGTVIEGVVDRKALGARVIGKPAEMKRLEAIVHPLVRAREIAFLDAAKTSGVRVAILDIPLLFETGGEARVHAGVVVTAAARVQRARVLARPGMSEETFAAILAKQMPDTEKRRRAHFLVDTGHGKPHADRTVRAILRALAGLG